MDAIISFAKRVLVRSKKEKPYVTPETIRDITLKFGQDDASLYDLRSALFCVLGFAGLFAQQRIAGATSRRCVYRRCVSMCDYYSASV